MEQHAPDDDGDGDDALEHPAVPQNSKEQLIKEERAAFSENAVGASTVASLNNLLARILAFDWVSRRAMLRSPIDCCHNLAAFSTLIF